MRCPSRQRLAIHGLTTAIVVVTLLAPGRALAWANPRFPLSLPLPLPESGDVDGTVTDSASGHPIPSVEVTVQQGASVVASTTTDVFGRFIIHDIAVGTYTAAAHFIGFHPQSRTVAITSGTTRVDFQLVPAPQSLETVQISSRTPVAVDTRTGDQTYNENDSHAAPTTTTSGILQQSIAGAARAPTGEVHIRGQHAEYQYYIDGVPVPSGVAGSLNELFDPAVVQHIDFQTGGWDAEYGGKNAAVINIQTRVPAGPFHGELATYGGSYGSLGQSLTMSGNQGNLGGFFSGTVQGSGMRIEPVVGTPDNSPVNYHNNGQDYFGFGKLQYIRGHARCVRARRQLLTDALRHSLRLDGRLAQRPPGRCELVREPVVPASIR